MEIKVVTGDITTLKTDAIILSTFKGSKSLSGDIAAVDKALAHAKLHREIAFQEMTAHRVLSDDWTKQETEFASGIKVRADYRAKTWKRMR